jgi:predicted O-methyltransferase YrrM
MAKTISVQQKIITLELTSDEAEALLSVLASVGGDPKTTRRKFVDSAYEVLCDEFPGFYRHDIEGKIMFMEKK